MNAQIGARLREQREALGYTQAQLAAKTGVATRTYIYYERGERAPDSSFLLKAQRAGIDIAYVMGVSSAGGDAMSVDPQLPQGKVQAAVIAVRNAEIARWAFLQPDLLFIAIQHTVMFGESTKGGYAAFARRKVDELLRTQSKINAPRQRRQRRSTT